MASANRSPRIDTRHRLLEAALQSFGHRDYDTVSTREIVRAAGTNISAISYHFGGKKELYLATAGYLANALHEGLQPLLQRVEAETRGADRARCVRLLQDLVKGFVENLLGGRFGEDAPGLIFREQNHPTDAFEILFARLLQPMHAAVSKLVGCIRGLEPDAPEAILVTHALVGQVIAFRAGRTTVLRRLCQPAYRTEDVREIGTLLSALATAALDYRVSAADTRGHRKVRIPAKGKNR